MKQSLVNSKDKKALPQWDLNKSCSKSELITVTGERRESPLACSTECFSSFQTQWLLNAYHACSCTYPFLPSTSCSKPCSSPSLPLHSGFWLLALTLGYLPDSSLSFSLDFDFWLWFWPLAWPCWFWLWLLPWTGAWSPDLCLSLPELSPQPRGKVPLHS